MRLVDGYFGHGATHMCGLNIVSAFQSYNFFSNFLNLQQEAKSSTSTFIDLPFHLVKSGDVKWPHKGVSTLGAGFDI